MSSKMLPHPNIIPYAYLGKILTLNRDAIARITAFITGITGVEYNIEQNWESLFLKEYMN